MAKHSDIIAGTLHGSVVYASDIAGMGGQTHAPATDASNTITWTLGNLPSRNLLNIAGRTQHDAAGTLTINIGGTTYFSLGVATSTTVIWNMQIIGGAIPGGSLVNISYFYNGTQYNAVSEVYDEPVSGETVTITAPFVNPAIASCVCVSHAGGE